MPKTPAEVTDTELAILNLLWERGPSQVRHIVEGLYPQHTPVLHATVKSLLERLTDKGFVECDRSRFAHKFASRITREAYVGQQLQKLADSHFDGSIAPMLLTLIDRVKLSRKEREAIRKVIEGIK